MKKRWYDFLWIASLLYLVLGFFNILFAWLGLLCFFIPLVIAFAGGDKGYCNRFVDGDSCSACWVDASASPGGPIFPGG